MPIPSYDDLAASIPDVNPEDLLAVDRLLPSSGPVAPRSLADTLTAPAAIRQQSARTDHSPQAPKSGPTPLFACLYSPHVPEAAVAIAKEFSPRYQRYGTDSVVVDVSGLGRLLGDAAAIGAELARAAGQVAGHGPRTADCELTIDYDRSAAPRSTSRYGIRIQPQPLEQTTFERRIPDDGQTDHGRRTTDDGSRISDHGICVAVAPTQMAALLLARAGAALVAITQDLQSALAGLSIEALRQLVSVIHGATLYRGRPNLRAPDRPNARVTLAASPEQAGRPTDRATGRPGDRAPDISRAGWPPWRACEQAFDTLARWGLRTLGEFAALPAGGLSARLGQTGVRLQELARGIDPRPLVPEPDAPRFIERMDLEWPIDGLEPLSFVLARLLDPLTAALERADRGAAVLRLDLRLTDRATHRRVLQLPAALRDARVFRTLLVLDLESHPPAAAIDVVIIEIDPAPARVLQYSLLEPATASAETLATLTARLGALVGDARCGTPWLADTYRPDAFEMRPFAPDDRRVARAQPGSPDAGSAICLRRFRPPVAIRVTVDRGRPVHVAIDRRGMPGGCVEQSAGPWRTSGAWWCAPDASWNRDEWDVTFGDGTTARLFRERATGHWFMEAIVD